MNLGDLFQSLSYGPLSNLSLANDGGGAIKPQAQPRIVQYTNEALTRLYARFVLKEKDVLVQMQEDITFYHLVPRFAVNYTPMGSEDSEDIRYILDLPHEQFLGDVVKILTVFDGDGNPLGLNDEGQVFSVYTPQANVLQVPVPTQDKVLTLYYQAKHPKLEGDLEETIELPDVLLEALTSFISYKVYSHMNTQDSTAKSQEHYAVYESICKDVVERDTVNTSVSTANGTFSQRGWI